MTQQDILELLRRELPRWPESVLAMIAVTELAALAALEVSECAKAAVKREEQS